MYNIEFIKSEIKDLEITRLQKKENGTLAKDEEKVYFLATAHQLELLTAAYHESKL